MQSFALVMITSDSQTILNLLRCDSKVAAQTLLTIATEWAREAAGDIPLRIIRGNEDVSRHAGSHIVRVSGGSDSLVEVSFASAGSGWFTWQRVVEQRLAAFYACVIDSSLQISETRCDYGGDNFAREALAQANSKLLVCENKLADAQDEILCLRQRLDTLSYDHSVRLTEIETLRSEKSLAQGSPARAQTQRYGGFPSTGKLIENFDKDSLLSRSQRTQILRRSRNERDHV